MVTTQHAEDFCNFPPRAALGPTDTSRSLHVGIVGAGIGGLMAALTLLESGHDVEIYEKSSFKSEAGAAVSTPPNSSRILEYYGFDFDRARATVGESAIVYPDCADLQNKVAYPLDDFVDKWGAPWCFFHRVDLHDELRRMAIEPSKNRAKTARLRLATPVIDIDLDGTIRFANGQSMKKDLVVAADGIRSSFLSTVLGDKVPSTQPYMSMLRLLCPTEKLPEDPDTRTLFQSGHSSIRHIYGNNKSITLYTCREGSLQNIGIIYPPEVSQNASGNDIPKSEDFTSKVLEEYGDGIKEMCRRAQGVGQWKLFTREPVPRLARGCVVVIGDAAHPMPPLRAQGAAMAIEDAAVLGVLLSHLSCDEEISARLDMFNELRVKRVAVTQLISSQHKWDPAKIPQEHLHYFDGKIPQGNADMDEFSYASNVIRDAYEALMRLKQGTKTSGQEISIESPVTSANL